MAGLFSKAGIMYQLIFVVVVVVIGGFALWLSFQYRNKALQQRRAQEAAKRNVPKREVKPEDFVELDEATAFEVPPVEPDHTDEPTPEAPSDE